MPILYKYLPLDRDSYFSDSLLRFTQPAALNDPFECIPIISIEDTHTVVATFIKEQHTTAAAVKNRSKRRIAMADVEARSAKMIAELRKDPELLRRRFYEMAHDSLNSQAGILSLSRRWNSTLMWSHYSTSHQGFCVGFDSLHQFFCGGTAAIEYAVRPVVYADKRIKVPVVRGERVDFEVMYTKSTDWAYEEEERLLALLKYANGRKALDPYPICLFKVPHDAVREVVVGAKAPPSLMKRAETFSKEHGCPLFRSVVSDSSFDMDRSLILGVSTGKK